MDPEFMISGIELGPLLGAGASAVVHAGVVKATQQDVAIKIVHPHPGHPAGLLERALQEGRIGWAVHHPNVVRVMEWGLTKTGAVYIVMERLRGETLAESLMARQKLPLAKALDVGRQMAAGVTAVHALGALHRDIKPENTWITREGQVKLLDLGLVHLRNNHPARMVWTGVGLVMGTVGYLAPEQARGESVDVRTDIYGLGATLFDAIVGHAPYTGGAATQVLAAIAESEGPPKIPGTVPSAVARLLRSMLHPDRKQRPASAEAVLDVLGRLEGGAPVVAEGTLDERRFPDRGEAEGHLGLRARISAAAAVALRDGYAPEEVAEHVRRIDQLQSLRRDLAARADDLRRGAERLSEALNEQAEQVEQHVARLQLQRSAAQAAYAHATSELIDAAESVRRIDTQYTEALHQIEADRRRGRETSGLLGKMGLLSEAREDHETQQSALRNAIRRHHRTVEQLQLQILELRREALRIEAERLNDIGDVDPVLRNGEDELEALDRAIEHAYLKLGLSLQIAGLSGPRAPATPPPLPDADRSNERPVRAKPDRREHRRVNADVAVKLLGSGRDDDLHTRDIGVGGCFIYSANPAKLGDAYSVEFAVEDVRLALRAVVVQQLEGVGFGLRFGTMSQGKKDQLARLIYLQENPSGLRTMQ